MNKTRYCQNCGAEMNQTPTSHGFDRFTGEEIRYIRYVCPTLNWEEMLRHEEFNGFGEIFKGHYYFEEKQSD